MELHPTEVYIKSIAEDVVATSMTLADRNGNSLALTCEEGLPTFMADPIRLRQVFLNLLSNACKFTTDGSIEIDIRKQTKKRATG